jgi:uncharacterized repeat protein (TIGR03803 family)
MTTQTRRRIRATYRATQLAALAVMFLGEVLLSQIAHAQTFSILYSFRGGSDGLSPDGLVVDSVGNLYGTTAYGGSSASLFGCGTLFKLDPAGNKTILYSFNGIDGGSPLAGIVRDANGNFYGTTYSYGAYGHGVVFKVDSNGIETVLYSFQGAPDGEQPYSTLILDAAGNLYGTTMFGGGSKSCVTGCGTIFKVDPSGRETVLYSFSGGLDGEFPQSSLVRGPGGNLFGATPMGGSSQCFLRNGCGVVFKVDPTGNETVLHSFAWGTEGANPYGSLVFDSLGNLYGATLYRGGTGCQNGCGAVFKLDPTGKETVLHAFAGFPTDGANPFAGLIRDAAGNLYGTTTSDWGTVFKLSPTGVETLLYSFGFPGAYSPTGNLVQDSAGNLYGAAGGGEFENGVIYKIAP